MSTPSTVPAPYGPSAERPGPGATLTRRDAAPPPSAKRHASTSRQEQGPSFAELLGLGDPRNNDVPGAASPHGDAMRAVAGDDSARSGTAERVTAAREVDDTRASEAAEARDEGDRDESERGERGDGARATRRDDDRQALRPTSARALQMSFEARATSCAPPHGAPAAAAGADAQLIARRLLRSMSVRHRVDGSTAVELEVGSGRMRGLRVDLTLQGGRVAARMRAADGAAARLLDGAEEALGAALAKRGVELADVSVEVDPRGSPRRDGRPGGDSRQRQQQRDDNHPSRRERERAGRFALGVG